MASSLPSLNLADPAEVQLTPGAAEAMIRARDAGFLLVGWIIMLVVWYWLGLPLGPDSPLLLTR